MINLSDLLEQNLSNLTEVNPARGLPRYEVNPNYTMIFLINTIILSIVLKKYNEKLIKIFDIKNPRFARLLSTGFLLDMLHWGNLFFLVYNLIIQFIPQDPMLLI